MKLKYVLDGKELSGSADTQRGALARCPVICTIAETDQEQEVHGFKQEDDFQRWARGRRFAAKLDETNELLIKAREYETRDHRRALERQQILNQRTLDDLRGLAQQSGLSPTSKELFDLAHGRSSPLEPPILHSGVLFDTSAQSGVLCVLPLGIPIPTFAGGNDRASYLTMFGVLVTLSDKTWWRGAKAYFSVFGTESVTFTLSDVGFSNRAASGVSL